MPSLPWQASLQRVARRQLESRLLLGNMGANVQRGLWQREGRSAPHRSDGEFQPAPARVVLFPSPCQFHVIPRHRFEVEYVTAKAFKKLPEVVKVARSCVAGPATLIIPISVNQRTEALSLVFRAPRTPIFPVPEDPERWVFHFQSG